MGFNDFWINNNGKKEHLNNAKHGVRKEQVDKKFHNLFDAYDANGDETLETEELDGVFKGLTKFAGADKTLDATENKQVASLFENQAGIEDADFMGFVKSISTASEDIVESKETPTADGGREVTTTYKDGSVETISYYPDGEYKFKKLDQKGNNESYYIIGNNDRHFTAQEIENQLKTNYNKYLSNFKPGENKKPMAYQEFKTNSMSKFNIRKINSDFERHNLDLSERAKKDIEVRDFVLNHYIETHKAAQEALESMGILDDVGAAINARAGELWNSIKNVWNGTEEEYQNFYELSKKFEPNYDKALRTDGRLDVMRNNPEMFFRGFETDFKKDMGHQYNLENSVQFQQTAEQYQNAQILKQRIDILNKAMQEVRMYQSEQDALVHAPAQNEGLNPASHIVSANKLLLQYFNNDQEAVDMILNGTIGNADATIKAISGIKEDTEKLNKAVLDGKTFDQIQEDYKSQYKAMYGTDFVPDELTEKVMDAKATGGMVKLAAITIVSILITKSPIMAEISGAAAGSAEATGAAANLVRTLVTKYGQTAVQQGIKLAMTSGTLATDVGLTLINQATSERGVNGEELLESTKGSAKYIFFGAYVGAPMAQAVSRSLGKIGATSRLFEGGTKTANGAIQTTSISGDKLIQNFVKGGNKVLTTGGAFLTDVAAFTGLEVATEGANLQDALSEQGQMLSKLKVMNHVLEYMLGAKAHNATSRGKMESAIEKSGVKNWNIKEIKTPEKTQYVVDVDGIPVGKFEDANQLATAMIERVSANYDKTAIPEIKAETVKPKSEVKISAVKPESEVVTDVKSEGVKENPLLTRLETANDRESFVAIRDEIKKMPNSEEKTQMMQAYLKKYNEWSSNPSRPDIRMQYMPERDGTEIPVANKTTTQTVSNKAFINIEDAKAKLQEFASEERDYTDMIIQRCSMNNQVSEVLLNEAISLLKSGVDSYDVSNIVYGFKVNDEAIDYNRIKKFHELVDKGTNAEDASHLLGYSADKKGLYSEDLYNKIMSLNEQDYDASRVLDACKIDGEVVESTWQKALELNSLGFKNRDIENVLKSCRIKESEARTAKTIGFNDEAYSKAKLLFEEHKFESENISRIIERCTVDGKFSQECFDRAISLHDKISESNIYNFVRYPNELLDFMLEIKDKYNIKEYELDYILRECVNTVDGKTVTSPICLSKAEELIAKYNFKADDVGHLLYASKVDGELDLKLYEEVIKMHQAGFNRIGSIIESLTTKGQNEGETSQVNYDLLQKTKEWKELGIEDDWISQYCREFEGSKIDVNKHDLVKEYHSADFKPNEIRYLLAANGNLENLSLTEFRDKVFELKKLGLDNNKIVNLLNGIGMPDGWGTPKFKLSKQNLDMVIDMIQRGVKEPDRIVRASYENYELNQDILNTAYERIKDGISEDRLSCLNSMRRYFTEMPELEDVLINLSKTVREDYDYNSFYSLANNVYNEMYNSKSGKDVANNVIEALKKGAKEEDIKYILDTNYGDPLRINRDNLNKSEVISQIKTKLLNALVEHPENTEQIKDITNSVARTIVDGDLSQLDFCLKYPDRYRDILRTEHPLDWNGNRRSELSNRARNLMLQFDSAGVPIDDVLKYTDILCENTHSFDEPIPENTLNKIIELRNNQKLDDNTLKMIRHLPFAEKTPELIDYVMDLKEKNLLPEFNEQNEYDIPVLVRILPNNSETGKLGLYENYKEILDFYVKNKDVLRYERVNGENHYITEFDDIVRNYKEHHSGIDKALDLEPFEAMAEIVRKTSISPETLNGIIGNGYADKLKVFTDKVDLEKYSNELNLIFSQLNRYYDHNSYSDILNENISKRDLEYLLDMQKLMCENVKENENPQILDNRWFRKFIGEKEIPAEALDKLRYYVEMELADPNRQGRYINIDRYHHTVRLYENSPENIERIESIMYNKGFEDGMYEHILSDLSSTPEVLNRQLDLIENILDYTGELSGHKSYLQSDLISILRDAKTLEDVNVKIELWEQLKSQLQSKSSIQKFWDANVKKQNNLGMALMCVEGTNATNKSAVLAAMANKKYSDLIWNCAGNIDKNNVALIEDIIKNDRLKNPDHANFAGIVVNTSKDEFKAKFVQENFDKIPQEDLQKATSILSEINGDLIIRLYNDKELNFPKEHILDIAPYCNQMNIDLVTCLCTDKNLKFPADQIKDIARALNLTNLELAEKLCTDKSLKCPPDKIVDILNAFQLINVDTKSLSLSQKINTLGTISSMDKTLLNLCRQYSPIDIDAKIAELTVSLGKKKDIINVSAAQQQMFVQNMMANNNQNTETVLKNFDFEQYGKQGLPLKYTREQFTANIENLIKDLSPEEQEVVLEHFGLIKGSAGFDGLPTNKPFNNEKVSSQVNEIAQKVQDEIETFTARNQINTGDAIADNVLNGLIKGLPEFTSIVGKEQHGTHAYSVDIHTLKVLQSAMNNPLYEKLSDRDKTILKIAALCHDLGKRGGVVDTGHASSSAEYVTAILDKFPFPQGMKDRIIDIVDNHHWFEAYNTGSATAEDVAVRCRRPEDFMIYEILAKADFENVNKDFHISRSEGVTNQAEFDKFMQDKMEAIDEALTRMYSRANLVFDTQFMQNGEKFPRQTIEVDGEPTELKVLNLGDLKGNDSLQEYGFSTGVTKESARFTVHMTDPVIASMESVMILTQNSLNQSAWSTSLIKASNNRTYCNRKFGFVLDVDQANISEANYANTGSGCGKGLETFKRILFNANGSARTYVKDHLIKELSKKGVELNDNKYAQLSRFLVAKKYTTQITKNIKIGDKIINAKDLVECLEKSRDALFEGGDMHSEIVPINPRVKGLIAKVGKLEDCPEEFLKFAKLHNLPIILMKPTKE